MNKGDPERSSPDQLPSGLLVPLGLGGGGGYPCCLLLQEALPDSPGLGHCLFGASTAFGAVVHIPLNISMLSAGELSPLPYAQPMSSV